MICRLQARLVELSVHTKDDEAASGCDAAHKCKAQSMGTSDDIIGQFNIDAVQSIAVFQLLKHVRSQVYANS